MNENNKRRKKLTALLVLLTFIFTSIVPTNIMGWYSVAEAAPSYNPTTNTITLEVGETFTVNAADKFAATKTFDTRWGELEFTLSNCSWSTASNEASVTRTGMSATVTGVSAGTTTLTGTATYSRGWFEDKLETSTWIVHVVAAAQEEQPGTEQIELNKTATIKTGSGDAQLFDVDLSVKGATVHEEKLLDVVLILDASSSMSQSLINATKNAAKTFVDGIYANSNIDARIAVVKYGDTASARDFSTSSAWDEYGRTVYGSEHYSNNKSDINKAIDTLSRNGATNTEGAFLVANELALLKRTGAEHITVFMTDGVPTKRYTTGTNTDSNGSYTELNDYNDALSAAIALSANSVIYNVGLTAGLDEYPYDNLIAEKFMEQPPYAMTQDSNNDRRTPSFSSTPYANYAKAYYNITSSNANEIATEMAQIYADIAIEAMNLATGKVVDVIPADFVLANESDLRANAAAAGYGITITNNADGTTTVEYTGVDAGDTLKTLPTITVQYTGDGYGAEYTNVTAYYEGALYNGEAFSKPFPKPVAGVRPVTDVDTATALVNEPILIDVAANDPFDQLVLPGYTVSNYAIIITDEHGNVKNYTDAANQFTAVVKDGKVEFVSSTDSTKQFYYVISATITANAGYSDSALPADGKLISKPTLVTVNLIPKIDITVTKEWKAPNDVTHPDITINLLQDGQPYESIVLKSGTQSITFSNLPAKNPADLSHVYQYTVTEEAVAGYNTSISSTAANQPSYTITNTITGTMDITGIKTWYDDGKTHNNASEVTLQLERFINGVKDNSFTAPSPYWSGNHYHYTNLPKYDANGQLYTYKVTESAIPGYKSVQDGNNFTNTQLINISGTKTWVDPMGTSYPHDNTTDIKLTLIRISENLTETLALTPKWSGSTYTFENLEKYDSQGALYEYRVSEEIINKPTGTYYETIINGLDIKNVNTDIGHAKTELLGTKVWVDGNLSHNNPTELTLILQRTFKTNPAESDWETVVLNTVGASMHWNGNTFHYVDLPKYCQETGENHGKLYTYRVKEAGVDTNGYVTIHVNGVDVTYQMTQSGTTITNTIVDPANVVVTGTKTWVDGGKAHNNASDITLTLSRTANGVTETVTAAPVWNGNTYTFSGLDKYDAAGYEYVYKVTETPIDGYTTTMDGFNIRNEITDPMNIVVTGTKTWVDGGKAHNNASEITLTLSRTANGVTETVTATPVWNGNTYTFSGLDKYDANGYEYTYSVSENAIAGYTTTQDGNNFTNTITDLKDVKVSGIKTWFDGNNQGNTRPDKITVILLADGVQKATQIVTASNNWKYEFNNLDKYDAEGYEIEYSVSEVPVAGYTAIYSGTNITNTITQQLVSVEGKKIWVDGNRHHNNAVDLTLTLQRSVNGTTWEAVADAHYTWRDNVFHYHNLPKYDADGYVYQYRVLENNVVNNEINVNGVVYKVDSAIADSSNAYTLQNTIKQESISVTGTKTWQDSVARTHNNKAEIDLLLTRISAAPNATEEPVNVAATWTGNTYTFSGLDKYDANGYLYTYSVSENGVNNGTITISVNGTDVLYQVTQNGNDIINTELIDIQGQKIWNDDNNRDHKRPASITVWLWADQTRVTSKTVTEADGWKYSFVDQPAYIHGHKVLYTVVEDAVENYTIEYVKGTYDVKNSYAPEITDIEVQKTWEDADNQDGIRPKGIKVTLLANGKYYAETILTAENNWWHHFTNLPKNENGKAIVYTVMENTVPAGYDENPDIHQDIKGLWHIVNTHTPETINISGQKTWDDANNQDGKRPASITVHLLADGEVVASEVVTAVDDWKYHFEDMPKYAVGKEGKEIKYTVTEEPVTGYTTSVKGYNITNKHVPESTSATVVKVWNDANNQDGKRPSSLKVTLSNGTEVTLHAANGWKATVNNLPMYQDGALINYTWTEQPVEGYTLTATSILDKVTTLTNTHTPEKVNIPITKVWNDANNQDGKRPTSLTLQLYANDTEVAGAEGRITISAADVTVGKTAGKDTWQYQWKNLDKYKEGKEILYRVREVDTSNKVVTEGKKLSEYTANYVRATDGAITITNTYTPETVKVKMQKVWNDGNNQDGSRPPEIYVSLLANGTVVETGNAVGNVAGHPGVHKVDPSTEWAKTITDLPKYANGAPITYSWAELQKETDGTGNVNYVNATDGKVIFVNNQNKIFEYQSAVTSTTDVGNNIRLTTVTNTYIPEKINVVVNKTWVIPKGETNVSLPKQDDPAKAIKVTLLKNNKTADTTITSGEPVTKVFEWKDDVPTGAFSTTTGAVTFKSKTITWSNLPRYEYGKEIVWDAVETLGTYANDYAVSETVSKEVINGVYTITINLTNTYDLTHRSLLVNKVWEDNDNQDGKRPVSVDVQLYYSIDNGAKWELIPNQDNPTAPTVNELTTTNSALFFSAVDGRVQLTPTYTKASDLEWGYIWDSLPQYLKHNEQGSTKITYKVEEVAHTDIVNGNKVTTAGLPEGYYGYNGSVKVTNNLVGEAINQWAYKITNYHDPITRDVTVQKVWNDMNDQDDTRPDSITVQLYANGNAHPAPIELKESNSWTGKWANLPTYYGGQKIEWTVREMDGTNHVRPGGTTSAGYKVTYEDLTTETNRNSETGPIAWKITNTREPNKISVPVTKVWDDANNQAGMRPSSVTVQLYANGSAVAGETLVIDAAHDENHTDGQNQWTRSFTGLWQNTSGSAIAYTVREVDANGNVIDANGNFGVYTVSYDGTNRIITNSYTPETTEATVVKKWLDENNQDGKRPASLNVTLSNGTRVVEIVTLNEGNGWTAKVENLPKHANGKEIVYTWIEDTVPEGYTLKSTSVNGTITTLTNSYNPEITSVSGVKTWRDNNNESGLRPDSITVNLHANGSKVDSKEVTAANGWAYTFDNLPKYTSGQAIQYTITENAVNGYDVPSVEGFNIVNTLKQQTFKIFGEKHWKNEDGTAITNPEIEKVEITLFRDNVVVQTTTASASGWKYKFDNLPRYALDGDPTAPGYAHLYDYRIEEVVVDGYTSSYDIQVCDNGDVEVIITNTAGENQFVSISGTKIWNDNNDAMAIRPDKITVALLANGKEVERKEVTAADGWAYKFDHLAKSTALGAEIRYTVEEVDVPEGYVSAVVATSSGYDIVNTLYTADAGMLTVNKTVEGDAPKEKFKFTLKVKSTVNDWDAMKVYQKLLLDDAWEAAVKERDNARASVNSAEDAFKVRAAEITTSSGYRLIMAKEVDVTSGSTYLYTAYGFKAVNQHGNVVSNGTTGSSYNFMWKHDKVDAGKETGIVQRVINAIKHLAAQFSELPSDSKFLKALYGEVLFGDVTTSSGLGYTPTTGSAIGYTTASAIGFVHEDADRLFDAQRDLLDAEALVQATTEAALKFVEENVTTPTAIKLILPATNEVVYDSTGKTPNADGFFEVPFELFAGSAFSVKIESTTGAEISYEIVEILTSDTSNGYEGTEVYVDDALVSGNALTTGEQILSEGIDVVRFNNIYDDEPYIPPYIPPYVPEEPEEPEPTPEDPEEPKEPPVKPGTEIPNEPEEVPDDVVPTGDTNHPAPYFVMMLIGFFGLLFTRRRVK